MQINVSASEWYHMRQMATLGEFTTGIIHDLKNQLACIDANMTLVEVISQQTDGNPTEKYTRRAKRQLNNANTMIEQIMRLSAKQDKFEDFNLKTLVDDIVSFFGKVSTKTIKVHLNVQEGPHMVNGCQVLISNVILNLFANARDAIERNGTIEIGLKTAQLNGLPDGLLSQDSAGIFTVLSIKDSGCGIDPNILKDVFKPFYSTKDPGKANAGMGLSNVVSTIREHGGNLTVSSQVNVGTTFTVYLKSA